MILVINPWSTSIKMSLFRGEEEFSKKTLHIEEIVQQNFLSSLETEEKIEKIIIRIVHGGDFYAHPVEIDDEVLHNLQSISFLAPLHNPLALKILDGLRAQTKVPLIAVFDTAFHTTIPAYASVFPLPKEITEKNHIKKYWFHGISHGYVSEVLTARGYSKIISLHLGGWSSICAIKHGKSMDTSMGFTPSSGLVMNTRAGDVDADVILFLLKRWYTVDELESMINSESWVLWISGYSRDMREIQKDAKSGDSDAQLTFNAYIYQIIKYIGSYSAVLGWIDAISFTGWIGEGSLEVKWAICDRLHHIGIILDTQYFVDGLNYSEPTKISTKDSKIDVWITPANENLAMIRATKNK